MNDCSRISEIVQRHADEVTNAVGFHFHDLTDKNESAPDEAWSVPIQPDRRVENIDLFDLLARIETEVLDQEDMNVLLVPVDPVKQATG